MRVGQEPGQGVQSRYQRLEQLSLLNQQFTMRFGNDVKVLAECKLKYYRVSECH